MVAETTDPAPLDVSVDEAGAGTRLDVFLATSLENLSRTRIAKLIQEGNVCVNDIAVTLPKHKLKLGDVIVVAAPPPAPPDPEPEDIPLDIAYEDHDVIVLNKPPGLVVHPAPGHDTGTLVNALIYHCGDTLSGIGGVRRPGIVHRLDRETSGLLVVAKNDKAHQHLAAQFADHGRSGALKRQYQALVWGQLVRPQTINQPIGRSPHNRQKQAVTRNGRQAVTHVDPGQFFMAGTDAVVASEIACRLETGRTHQIRVHLAHIGFPVIGDQDYGKGFITRANALEESRCQRVMEFKRQALHARELGFSHPTTGEAMLFCAEPPEDYRLLRDALS